MLLYTDVLHLLSHGCWHSGGCDPLDCESVIVWMRCMHCSISWRLTFRPGVGGDNKRQWITTFEALRCHKLSHKNHTVQLWYTVVYTQSSKQNKCLSPPDTPGFRDAKTIGTQQQQQQQQQQQCRELLFDHLGVLLSSHPMGPRLQT